MLNATARPAANTPAAPLTAQNHGVGRESIALTISIPVGNPKPIRMPEGMIAVNDTAARMASPADAKFAISTGNQNGSRIRYRPRIATHSKRRALLNRRRREPSKLPIPVDMMIPNRPMARP